VLVGQAAEGTLALLTQAQAALREQQTQAAVVVAMVTAQKEAMVALVLSFFLFQHLVTQA
jgi:hypothetical protein